jgi:hypothetical protein
VVLVSVLLAVTGCSDVDSGPPWIELGAGLDSFRSLSEGDSLSLVHGAQGGWHIDLALRFGGFGPDGVHLSYSASDPENGDELSFVTEALLQERLVSPVDQGWERLGDRLVFDVDSADQVIDQELLIEVVVSHDEQQWSDSQRVLVVDQ